ncbi:MAG TPA: alpha/beta fold hydrolase [Pyrinomonadaceae bacterium]|nr:alpha/beta fold hydrolase [Pyrinomonadaceae bacterium]
MPKTRINNIDITYDDTGSGPAVVLIHGYPFNRSMWAEQVSALADSYRVVTLDLRGHGESESSTGASTMKLMAQDVAALMDELQIDRAVIGGLSMGGYVTLAFYQLFAERVEKLLLADTRAQADTEEAKATRGDQVQQIQADGMTGIVTAMLPKLLSPETVSKQPEIVKRVRDMMMHTSPEGAIGALRGMAEREDQTERLSQINVPALIVVGKEDPITPVADSQKMHERIAGSQLVVIENASHVSNIEQSEQFNRALREFLSS